ncbi:MAG: hypothetical protein P8X55_19200 [Desulfosarcinaceae bacterium]
MQALTRFFARLERFMVAATFAEANCPDTARQIMDEGKRIANQRPTARVSDDRRPTLHM